MFSPLLTIYDKPLSDMRPIFFDDEGGVITYDKAIVENGGEFKTLLFNTALAKRRGTSSTGNAGWMHPSPWNLEVAGGEKQARRTCWMEMGFSSRITGTRGFRTAWRACSPRWEGMPSY